MTPPFSLLTPCSTHTKHTTPTAPLQVTAEVEAARGGNLPPLETLYADIFINEVPKYIRLPNRVESKITP